MVKMLLDKGADGSALQAASSGGHDQMVQILLPIIKQREMSMIFRKTFIKGNTFHIIRNLDKKSRFVYYYF